MNDLKDLELIIHSGTPVIALETKDEIRSRALFQRLGTRLGKPIYHWSIARGLEGQGGTPANDDSQKPEAALGQILQHSEPGIYLFFDIQPHLEEPIVVRLIRELAQRHSTVAHTLVLVGVSLDTPDDLRGVTAKFVLSLPTAEQIRSIIAEESELWGQQQKRRVQAQQSVIDAIVTNLVGLASSDVQRIVRTLIYDDGILSDEDIEETIKAKYTLLDNEGVLSFETDTARFDDVAGLRKLKEWLSYRREVFIAENPPAGIDPPKGMLLLGVQGSGKSLAAKSIAGAWSVPLLRLDFAALYNKFYGETERNLREALKTAEVMAPCVLWIDEIEKGLSTDADSGGPSKRILGTLLTWMSERKSRVFLVATANDIEALPPELLRKGRFDEIFFVDLPKPDVREAIFSIHLKKREHNSKDFDLVALGNASDKFSGAEIEQAVVAAIYAAFAKKTPLTSNLILEEIKQTKPLSILMAEKINYLRSWAAERTVPAD
jgi:SpoVK/Ycf46/Vps4 family AAA+-type ATPase